MKRVLVVGGSEEYVGAPYLAAMAALRGGAESVIVVAPEKVAWAINALSPDLMTRKIRGKYLSKAHERAIRSQMKTADILVIGNGAGTRPGTVALMRPLMRAPILKVVDADALKALRMNEVQNAILTPNAGEWKLLTRVNDAKKLARNTVIIKKGFPTTILSGSRKRTVRTHKGLAKAGTGDVLAGLVAGFLARGLPPLTAAQKASEAGNAAAEALATKKRGSDFIASDLLKTI